MLAAFLFFLLCLLHKVIINEQFFCAPHDVLIGWSRSVGMRTQRIDQHLSRLFLGWRASTTALAVEVAGRFFLPLIPLSRCLWCVLSTLSPHPFPPLCFYGCALAWNGIAFVRYDMIEACVDFTMQACWLMLLSWLGLSSIAWSFITKSSNHGWKCKLAIVTNKFVWFLINPSKFMKEEMKKLVILSIWRNRIIAVGYVNNDC